MYNFIFHTTDWHFTKYQLADILNRKDVCWKPGVSSTIGHAYKLLHKIHFSERINQRVHLPGKYIWYKAYSCNSFAYDKPICFVFFGSCENSRLIKEGYIKYLRKKYSDAKFVYFLMDRMALKFETDCYFDLDLIKGECDFIGTINPKDAEKYNILFYTGLLSKLDCSYIEKDFHPEILFVGLMKDRLNTLYSIFERAESEGLKCSFYITGVPPEKQKYKDKIVYNQEMDYHEMVQKSVNAKCLLELAHRDTLAYTSRFAEAVMYNKRLLTNLPTVKNSPYYDKKNIQIFSNSDEIDFEFIKSDEVPNYKYRGEFSPNNFLDWIEDTLNKLNKAN